MQLFNSVLIHESSVSADEEPDLSPFQLVILALCFSPRDLHYRGRKNKNNDNNNAHNVKRVQHYSKPK